jgi:hypothetical protein
MALALVGWLALVLAGREHALAAVGIHLACVHPGSSSSRVHDATAAGVVAAQPDADVAGGATRAASSPVRGGDEASIDAAEGDDCPPGCTDCACGAAPCVPPAPSEVAARGWALESFAHESAPPGPTRPALTPDRPPRRG